MSGEDAQEQSNESDGQSKPVPKTPRPDTTDPAKFREIKEGEKTKTDPEIEDRITKKKP